LNKTSPRAHTDLKLDVLGWCSWEVCEICSSLIQKKLKIKTIFLHTSCPNCNRPIFGLKEF
jgi:hypothetical protein